MEFLKVLSIKVTCLYFGKPEVNRADLSCIFSLRGNYYSACQQASQDLFDDAVRLERIFLRYEPKVVSSDSCTYTGLVQDQIATQLLGQQWSESTPMVVRGDGN
jgi:hypothetical protein